MIEFTICVWLLFSLLVYGLTNARFYKIDGKNHRIFSSFVSLGGPVTMITIVGALLFEDISEIGFKL